ncbi:hypothetical protein RB623_21750 [Mesorhizobium sp. LHD-90]|uniref:hypothetical protein n=1 Tax=Mesorhizobium sp. LHD-90 TaxID=3071414 RepID=UPI0027DFABD5|nr:hypothetical protein [Mesorhizobium sp. LHD-90]MDQ6436683.1 hypothetical protein [Mesorhizobium sp. LHD-90]
MAVKGFRTGQFRRNVSRAVAEAWKHIGAHFVSGACAATPGNEDGCRCRRGCVYRIAGHDRLEPRKRIEEQRETLTTLISENWGYAGPRQVERPTWSGIKSGRAARTS